MGKFKVIPIEVFNTDVLVSINQSDDKLYAEVCNKFTRDQFNYAWEDWANRSDARTVTHSDGFVIIRFRNKIGRDPKMIGLVSHEAYHAAYSILSKIGIQPGYETEEVYAYLVQYIVTEILKLK